MNDHTNNNKGDDDRISFLYQQGSNETPAPHINEKIMHHARKPSNNVISFPIRKVIKLITSSQGLAVAAVLVIGLSIILQIQFDSPEALMSPSIEESFENDLLSEMQDSSVAAEAPAASISLQKKSINKPLLSQSAEIESAQPTASAPKLPSPMKKDNSRSKSEAKSNDYMIKRRQESVRQQEKKSKQRLKIHSLEKQARKEQSEKRMKAISSELTSTRGGALANENCSKLTHLKCLNSLSCTLSNKSDSLICRDSIDYCESNFSQLDDNAKQCEAKKDCEYLSSECKCNNDTDESCICDDDTPPSCIPLNSEEDNQ